MRIQIFCSELSGISYHRFVIPFSYMEQGEHCYEILWTGKDENRIDCDVLIFNKFIACSNHRLQELKEQGVKIVMDVDDHWDLPEWHINYYNWQRSHFTEHIADNIRLADIVICTSMKLQEQVRKLNSNTVVIPNAFPFGHRNYIPAPVPKQKVTFIYAGGSTHELDVKLLRNTFRRIGKDIKLQEQLEFILAGYDPSKRILPQADGTIKEEIFKGVWHHMQTVFRYTNCSRTIPTMPLDHYIDCYDQADVALIPLRDNEWNSCKSVLKVLEAAAKGLPCIISKVEPYTELLDYPGILWVEKPEDWYTHILWCKDNKDQLQEMGRQLSEKVQEHFHLSTWNQVRSQVLHSLIKEPVAI